MFRVLQVIEIDSRFGLTIPIADAGEKLPVATKISPIRSIEIKIVVMKIDTGF